MPRSPRPPLHDALPILRTTAAARTAAAVALARAEDTRRRDADIAFFVGRVAAEERDVGDRKSTRLNSSHTVISYAVFRLKKKNTADLGSHSVQQRDRQQ